MRRQSSRGWHLPPACLGWQGLPAKPHQSGRGAPWFCSWSAQPGPPGVVRKCFCECRPGSHAD